MDFGGRRLRHPQHRVLMVIRLHDAAILQGDLAMERRRNPEDDGALDLRLHRVRVDDDAAIDRADDAADADQGPRRRGCR